MCDVAVTNAADIHFHFLENLSSFVFFLVTVNILNALLIVDNLANLVVKCFICVLI